MDLIGLKYRTYRDWVWREIAFPKNTVFEIEEEGETGYIVIKATYKYPGFLISESSTYVMPFITLLKAPVIGC